MTALYEPIPGQRFQAIVWRGHYDDLPEEWRDRVEYRLDGTLITRRTSQGPGIAPPDGSFWVREGGEVEPGVREIYFVPAEVFTERYRAVTQ